MTNSDSGTAGGGSHCVQSPGAQEEPRCAHGLRRLAGLVLILVPVWTVPAGAQDTATFFKQNCASCHTIGGGRLTGVADQAVERMIEQEIFQGLRLAMACSGAVTEGDHALAG